MQKKDEFIDPKSLRADSILGNPLASNPAGAKPSASDEETIELWLRQIPERFRPYRMTDAYPRIALKLAQLWSHPAALRQYFRQLVIDDRGDRQGFQAEIAAEIFRLSGYFEEKLDLGLWVGLKELKEDENPWSPDKDEPA